MDISSGAGRLITPAAVSSAKRGVRHGMPQLAIEEKHHVEDTEVLPMCPPSKHSPIFIIKIRFLSVLFSRVFKAPAFQRGYWLEHGR